MLHKSHILAYKLPSFTLLSPTRTTRHHFPAPNQTNSGGSKTVGRHRCEANSGKLGGGEARPIMRSYAHLNLLHNSPALAVALNQVAPFWRGHFAAQIVYYWSQQNCLFETIFLSVYSSNIITLYWSLFMYRKAFLLLTEQKQLHNSQITANISQYRMDNRPIM